MLVDHPLDAIETHLQVLGAGSVAETHEVVAGAVEQVAALGGVEVEEYTRDYIGGRGLAQRPRSQKNHRAIENTRGKEMRLTYQR